MIFVEIWIVWNGGMFYVEHIASPLTLHKPSDIILERSWERFRFCADLKVIRCIKGVKRG